jgi:undecaprenyldiphospho-muramoylpentapeptide beta-N-acetylglucosaminyltransferase
MIGRPACTEGGAPGGSGSTGPVLIMAGGTGGHVFPALAVAERLRCLGVTVFWMGTRQGLEAELVPHVAIPIDWVSIGGLRSKSFATLVTAPIRLSCAFLQSLRIVTQRRPCAVLGMGGYVTGPGGLAAWLLRRPLLIHEQNAVVGLTNRLLSKLATCVMEAFPNSFPASYRPICTGNPVRGEVLALAPPHERLAERSGPLRFLVVGGSLGAKALNEVVPEALNMMPPEGRPDVWHQSGEQHIEATREWYRKAGVAVRLVPFIEDMAEAYGWADLVLCRAGALTVAELTAAGLASVLVPFPFAVDDHQTHNARFLVDAGAAVLVPQKALTAKALAELLKGFAHHRKRLIDMASAARGLARIDAAQRVAELCLQVAAHEKAQ